MKNNSRKLDVAKLGRKPQIVLIQEVRILILDQLIAFKKKE